MKVEFDELLKVVEQNMSFLLVVIQSREFVNILQITNQIPKHWSP